MVGRRRRSLLNTLGFCFGAAATTCSSSNNTTGTIGRRKTSPSVMSSRNCCDASGAGDGGSDDDEGGKGGMRTGASSTSSSFTLSRKMSSRGREAQLWHAIVVIFLEYFAWGLLTVKIVSLVPVINVLSETFPTNKFLMNGLTLGVKGLLSFLSAPLIGAWSDTFGRKKFLFITVFFTCMPIPCLIISPWWYFTFFTLSGLFAVTFSVTLAYVADITDKTDRNFAYGLVSATFAGSLITSPALGAYLSGQYSDGVVVLVATLISLLDLLFIALFVPESSLRAKNIHDEDPLLRLDRLASGAGSPTGGAVDPLLVVRLLRADGTVFQLATILFLSHLVESGQFSCFFVYLRLVAGFTAESVAMFIAFVGILSVISQTLILVMISQKSGPKTAITLGLAFQFAQLVCYGIASAPMVMWSAGAVAALSQITYPALSAFVSLQTDKELQGTVQGILSGIRGMCQGIGPAMFGIVFYIFDMDLESSDGVGHVGVGSQFPVAQTFERILKKVISPDKTALEKKTPDLGLIPGPPFLLGALLIFIAILMNAALPAASPGRRRIFRRQLFASLLPNPAAGDGRARHSDPMVISTGTATASAATLVDDDGNVSLLSSATAGNDDDRGPPLKGFVAKTKTSELAIAEVDDEEKDCIA